MKVLGLEVFDEKIMRERIREIRAYDENILRFVLADGKRHQRSWRDKSRADIWTDEMRAQAAEKTRGRYHDAR